VVLRWLVQSGVIVIPKSVRPERMQQNFDIFDFEHTADDMGHIAALDTGETLFFDHHDPEMVEWLNSRRDR
jgi:2,5-diketo-D-gluconate reductase A